MSLMRVSELAARSGVAASTWTFPLDRAGAVAELAAVEQRCCAFLEMRLDFGPRGVRLHVALRPGRAPEPGSPAARAARLLGALEG